MRKRKITICDQVFTVQSRLMLEIDDDFPICYAYATNEAGESVKLVWDDAWLDYCTDGESHIFLISKENVWKEPPSLVIACN